MVSSSFALALLSVLSTSVLAHEQPDHIERNLTVFEIPRDPSFTNSTPETVSYFEAEGLENNLVIIHGDVIHCTVPELHKIQNSTHTNAKRAFSIFKSQNVWPGGIVAYKWQSEAAKGAGRLAAWTEATKRWTDMLPWLVFKEYPASATLVADIMTLVPTVGQNSCFSPIGKSTSAGANQMMLDDNCGGAGTYAHELGHSLGLIHEHMRPDRDDYVIIHCDAVWDSSDGTPADCSQNCRGYGCNFRKLSPGEADWSGPYDSLSLMHYAPFEFGKGPGPAIEARPGVPTPQAHTFPTAQDAKRVCQLYSEECTGVCGDGIVTAGEECDDGNNKNGDGCSSSCKKEGNAPSSTRTSTSAPSSTRTSTSAPSSTRTSTPISSSTSGPTSTSTPGTCSLPVCNPWSATSCDITTTCTALGGATAGGVGQHLCACRHGYRASGHAANDASVQVRLPWKEQGGRVFVKPGVVCNQLCDNWQLGKDGCKEVTESPACY